MSLGFGLLPDEFQRKWAAWNNASPIFGSDSNVWREDDYGNTIKWDDYGDKNSPFGWEIDHVVASALGGPDTLNNLRALHCKANASLGGILSGLMRK